MFRRASVLMPLMMAAIVVFTGSSCAQNNVAGVPVARKGKPATTKGFVTGRVTDEQGRPLRNVTIYAGHTTWYNANVISTTDADGKYKLNISGRPGTYTIHGEMKRNHNGVDYKFDLYPDDNAPVSSTEGGVRNITWKKPVNVTATEWDGIGGFVDFMQEFGSEDYWSFEDVELTLVPVRQLADGSTGDTIMAHAVNFTNITGIYSHTGFANVPIGRYKIKARYAPANGTPVNLLLTLQNKMNYAKEITADFTQSSLGYQEIAMLIKFP